MTIDHQTVSLVVRWLHVASMALLLGGAILLCALATTARSLPPLEQNRLLLYAAERYELFFWTALGLLVITGVGNLGAFGMALPGAGTTWGGKFVVKLALVLLFVPLSLVRTLAVVRLDAQLRQAPAPDAPGAAGALSLAAGLRNLYGGTSLYAVAILFMAVFLAHGG